MMMLTGFSGLRKIIQATGLHFIKPFAYVFLVITSVSIPEFAGATHLIGGDLRYKCLGNNRYEIKLIYRRDCFLGDPGTEFEDSASIGFFNLTTGAPLQFIGPNGLFRIPRSPIDTATQQFISDCTMAGNDLCVEETFYVDTITLLPFQAGYKIVYQRCCRNNSLNNVDDPLNTGMTLVAELSFAAQQVCNSSPELGDYPPIYICLNRDVDFDFVAVDPDGDSLVFELFTPFLGASDQFPQPSPPPPPPYTQIQWNTPPYDLTNLLGGTPLTIDRFTGHMTGIPNTIGQFLVGVKVFSYRNGVLIETTTREWQYNVRACRDRPVADFAVSTELNCENLSIEFGDQASFADQYRWIFDYGNPNSPTSTDPNPMFTFPTEGFYEIALIVNDFDSLCFDTAYANVGVFESQLNAAFGLDVPVCDETIILDVLDMSSEPNDDYDITKWEYVLSDSLVFTFSLLQNPQFLFDQSMSGLNLVLTVTSGNGCTATIDTTFDVNIIQIPFKGDTVGICDGDSVALFDGPGGPFMYSWSPTDNLELTNPANPIAFPGENTTYHVTVTDGLCEVSDSAVVAVQGLPMLSFGTDTDCRSLILTTDNTSQGGFNFLWDFGDGSPPSSEESPVHTYDSAGIYTVTLISDDGCDADTSMVVTVVDIDEEIEDTSISCFREAVTLNPDGNPEYNYVWTPSQFLDDSTSSSPVAQVNETTFFYVTITVPGLEGCPVFEDVEVVVPPDFELQSTPDTAYCDGPPITLTGTNPSLSYVWTDLDNNILFEGPEYVTAPQTETSYIVIGTDSFGCSKNDTITLSPTFFNLETSAEDVVICFGDSTEISVINLDPSQDLTYQWEPAGLIHGDPTEPTVLVSPDEDQLYTVQIFNNEVGCMTTEDVLVRVSTFQLEYSPAVLICLNESITLEVGNFDTTNLMFMWEPVGTILNGTENTGRPLVMPSETTEYTATVTDNYGCMTTLSVVVTVSWFDPDSLVIFVNRDTIILGDTLFYLYTNQDPTLDFLWSGDGIKGSNTTPEITAEPADEGMYMYSVTVTNVDGCQLIGTTHALTVLDPLCNEETVFIPDAFSPNDDGENDELLVYSNFIESMELHIYNRWGEEVFVTRDQNIGWDGTYKGKELAPDVFGYYLMVICVPNKPYFRKGNITLFK